MTPLSFLNTIWKRVQKTDPPPTDPLVREADFESNPDIDCVTLPDGSCIADPCRLHDPRPKKTDPPCTGHPSTNDCTCTNGIGCINVPFEDW